MLILGTPPLASRYVMYNLTIEDLHFVFKALITPWSIGCNSDVVFGGRNNNSTASFNEGEMDGCQLWVQSSFFRQSLICPNALPSLWKSCFPSSFLPDFCTCMMWFDVFKTLGKNFTQILGWNCVKGLRVTKIVKQLIFEGVWDKLQAKNCLQRQPFTKNLRQTLVFMWNSALREKFNFFFSAIFC